MPAGVPAPPAGYAVSVIVPGSTTVVIPPGSYPTMVQSPYGSNGTATGNISMAGMTTPTALPDYRGAATKVTVATMSSALFSVVVFVLLL